MEINNSYQKVAWILDRVPAAQRDYKLLLLIYWQVFDEVDIPEGIITQIIEKGTEPETISRAKRKVIENNTNIEEIEKRLREAIENGKGNNQS